VNVDALFPFAVALVFLVVTAGGWWLQARRQKALQAWAAAIGWTWVGVDPSLVSRWQGQPFGVGSSRRATDVVAGMYGPYRALSFTYGWTTGSGKNRTRHTAHVMALALPAYLPRLQLTADGLGAKIATALGGQDIEFESEAFNRRWRVEARDAKFAHDVLHPRLLERLSSPQTPRVSVRIDGTDILAWVPGATSQDRLAPVLGTLRTIVDAIPRFVWLDHGYDPART
jgi:hypothetical protein